MMYGICHLHDVGLMSCGETSRKPAQPNVSLGNLTGFSRSLSFVAETAYALHPVCLSVCLSGVCAIY